VSNDQNIYSHLKEMFLAYLQCYKRFNHVVIQNIHERLLGVGLCNASELRATAQNVKGIPLSRLSVTSSHADLVVVGSARGSYEASTAFAFR
jgi:hypothetical protein